MSEGNEGASVNGSHMIVRCECSSSWVGDLCTQLHSFHTGTDNVWEGKPADVTDRPSSEFTGLLQLLKAVLQATELFSHRSGDHVPDEALLTKGIFSVGIKGSLWAAHMK